MHMSHSGLSTNECSQLRVLIVDDSATIREMLRDVLDSEGYQLLVATSGDEALSVVEESRPELVLLCGRLPDMSGLEVLQQIKSRHQGDDISVIMVTSNDEVSDVVTALDAGATDFVSKPFSGPIVRSRVRNALSSCVLLHQLRVAKEAAESATKAKSEFLAHMSHEIRTPMTAVLGFTDVLLERLEDPENLDATRIIKRNGQHLLDLINDILDLSKIEADKLDIHRVDCSAAQIVDDVATLMRGRAESKSLALKVEYQTPIPKTICSDPTRLRQILVNLIGNAIKFTESGQVILRLAYIQQSDGENRLQFEVIDSGIGLTHEEASRLFQPFVQANSSTTRRFGGTGLGLAICLRLTEMLGGKIVVESIPGTGSTFRFSIEVGTENDVAMFDAPPKLQGETAPKAARSEKLDARILLAEDGPDNQRLIAFVLKKAGADVVVAENGKLAYELALGGPDGNTPAFDLILMDIQMPVMDGYEATRKLRQAGYTKPIIALTAHAMSGAREQCVAAGCDDYAAKPIDRQQLIHTINHHLHRAATDDSTHDVAESDLKDAPQSHGDD